jgi:hypothetical protein
MPFYFFCQCIVCVVRFLAEFDTNRSKTKLLAIFQIWMSLLKRIVVKGLMLITNHFCVFKQQSSALNRPKAAEIGVVRTVWN